MNMIEVKSLKRHKFAGKIRPKGSSYKVKQVHLKCLKKAGFVDEAVFSAEVPEIMKQSVPSVTFILGGGQSVSDLDLGALHGQHVVAVNRSFETYPCSEMFFADMSFFEEFGDKFMVLDLPKVTVKKQLKDLPGVIVLRRTSDSKNLQRIPGQLISSNSGVMTLNYLLQKGCKLVVLMGMDLCEIGGRKHHHDGYIHPSKPKSCETMLDEWRGIREQVWEKFNADIIHATPKSALDEVEYLPLEDIVEAIKDKDYFGGWWLPKGEKHFRMMLRKSKPAHGRKTYQYQKLSPAVELVKDKKGIAIDVGSNVGFWAWHLAREFDHVHCFEPVPIHNECLRLNSRGVDNISIYEEALSDEECEVELIVYDGDCGATHVNQNCSREGETFTKVKSKCRTLDSYNFKNVKFLKIDCEGFELAVLKGAEKTLRENSPVIVVEQKKENERFDMPSKGAVEYLKSFGYVVRQVLAGDYIMEKE